eukprot:PITA_10915
MFQKIMITSSAKEAWDTLATGYKGMTKVNLVNLHNTRRDLESLHMKEIEDINSFVNQVMTIVNQLKATIEEAKDLTSLTVDELMGSLLSHEARRDINKDSTLKTAFKSQVSISRDRGRDRSISRGKGKGGRHGSQRDSREEHEHESGSNCKSFNNNQDI